jgi:hypothetical protein
MYKVKEELKKECILCGKKFILEVDYNDLLMWQEGDKHIQDALPYLTDGERELLISGVCEKCFDDMYGDEE